MWQFDYLETYSYNLSTTFAVLHNVPLLLDKIFYKFENIEITAISTGQSNCSGCAHERQSSLSSPMFVPVTPAHTVLRFDWPAEMEDTRSLPKRCKKKLLTFKKILGWVERYSKQYCKYSCNTMMQLLWLTYKQHRGLDCSGIEGYIDSSSIEGWTVVE